MKNQQKILIGGQALRNLGSSRHTEDVDYLVNDIATDAMFVFDLDAKTDYINANGHKFFMEIFNIEKENKVATPQSLLELKAFSFAQHCLNFNFAKADCCEFDIKYLVL